LDLDDLVFDEKKSAYKKTYEELIMIKKNLINDCNDALFIEPDDVNLKDPIDCIPHTALSYFYNKWKEKSK